MTFRLCRVREEHIIIQITNLYKTVKLEKKIHDRSKVTDFAVELNCKHRVEQNHFLGTRKQLGTTSVLLKQWSRLQKNFVLKPCNERQIRIDSIKVCTQYVSDLSQMTDFV